MGMGEHLRYAVDIRILAVFILKNICVRKL